MLSDVNITAARYNEEIIISPYDPARLQPNSYDVTLSSSFSYMRTLNGSIKPWQNNEPWYEKLIMSQITLSPGQFMLASTEEWIKLGPQIAARIEGKSSLGRLGLIVHTTAGFIDAGFQGQITLELLNVSPNSIAIRAGMPVAQLSFDRLDSPARKPYQGKYQDQRGATASAYHKNFEVPR